ncbi:type II secretion system F family protein [Geodermatophilus sp. SYSU D01062]
MPTFTYSATSPSGELTRGKYKAASQEAAELALYEQELRNIRVAESKSFLKMELTAPRVKREEVMHLSRQLGAFIRAGLPVVEAVRLIGEEASNSSVKRVMSEVEVGLRGGDTLSDCFDRHPKVFPEFYRGILRSAELTGQLDTVLSQLAEYLDKDLTTRRKIKSAALYPSVIAAMAVVTVAILAGWVLPRFKEFFAGLDAELPLPTRMLLGLTDFLLGYWWALLGGLVALVLVVVLVLQTERGKYGKDRLLLAVPVLGNTVEFVLVERFCRILSAMVGAGVALPEALRVASESLRNRVFIRSLSTVGESMLRGEGLAGPLSATGRFPGTATQMIRVGEETGTLDAQLESTAQYYEGELTFKIDKLTSLFEPAVLVAMGLIVGFVAVALVSAMYGIYNQVSV